ncbi:aminoglycoside phosphotransferase [Aspergillus terreus]|uniref:Altered inheritance of mitochondria protein 9, mitochondrial n=1 Tax=Aspergillus terreus TaxID=33178 RepID=A0A5M3YLU7_ASPTE|nr:hypothetical protein ATETN484_0001054800 [Aspergillus terreus]GFF12404.1 aminoglycoside phosphotransferase [Aspergillus terreus]
MDDGKTILARIPNPNAGPAFYTTASEVATMEFSWEHILRKRRGKWRSAGSNPEPGAYRTERASLQKIHYWPYCWSSPEGYASSVGWREVEWIKKYAVPKSAGDIMLVSAAQNDPRAHLDLLEKYLSVVPCLMDVDPVLCRPTLWHGDLHSSNFFVENNKITAVIDWQGSWAGPLYLQAQPSPLIDYQGSILLRRPDNFDHLDPERQAQIKRQIFKSTLFQLYLMETEKRNPLLAKAFHLDHGKTRRLPVELAGNTWDDEIVSFRESLINVERHWHDLSPQGDCPYHFTEEELRSHAADAEGWNEGQDFFDDIDSIVKRDGWTHPETFDAAFNFFSELRKLGLEGLKGEERERFDKQTSWAKNQR